MAALDTSRSVAVIGTGAMGAGIAQVAALAGYTVRLYDNRPQAVAKAMSDIAAALDKLVQKERLGAPDFGRSRQERQHRAGIGAQRGGDGVGHLPLDLGIRFAAEVACLHRKSAAEAFDHRRVAEQLCDARAVDGRGHHEDAEVLAQADLRVARQCEPHVGV